jgi:hypothetical protein
MGFEVIWSLAQNSSCESLGRQLGKCFGYVRPFLVRISQRELGARSERKRIFGSLSS